MLWYSYTLLLKLFYDITYQRISRLIVTTPIVIPIIIQPIFIIYFLASSGSTKNKNENPHINNHISFIDATILKIRVLYGLNIRWKQAIIHVEKIKTDHWRYGSLVRAVSASQ